MEKRKGITERFSEDCAGGRVWLVGAGPSDPGLFTLKGKQVLETADVVVYDALAGQEILSMIPENAKKIYVGKRSSHHTMPQEQISRLLVREAKEGRRVVRLKGGDPFLFGRGGEEAEELIRHGIPFEVVPGVTSAISVPAYQGIPVTHRDLCSSVHIITGHKRAGAAYDIDFEALVRTGGTLVFLMGVTALGDICRGLLAAGMDPEMPAALLIRGTTAHQRRIVASVSTLEEEVNRQGAQTPAIIVVGRVCALAEEFSWYGKMPLGGVKVLLTRPKELIRETAVKLRMLGAEVLEFPAIRTRKRQGNVRLYEALENIRAYGWLVFTSPAGVRIFFEEMQSVKMDVRSLGQIKIAVIGRGSARELEKYGLYADLMPEIYDGAHLGAALAQAVQPGERILIPRASGGSRELIQELSGHEVDDIPTYDTVFEEASGDEWIGELKNGGIDYVMFTSSSTVRGFVQAAGDMDFSVVRAICIGEQTRQTAKSFGMRTWMSEEAGTDSLIRCLMEVHQREEELCLSGSL